jgi:hypothetical protein
VDVAAEERAGVVFAAEERGAGQADVNGVRVGFVEVGEETAFNYFSLCNELLSVPIQNLPEQTQIICAKDILRLS